MDLRLLSSSRVAVLFRHVVLLFKGRPALDAWNFSIFGRPAFPSQTFNAIAKKGNAKAKNGETTCMGNRKKDS